MTDFHEIERFELIDHTHGGVTYYPGQPRAVMAKDVNVTVAVQDGGATLKIFLSREPHGTGTTDQRPPSG
jgi:hypothetical protein